MTSRERVFAHLAGQSVERLPLMPITMMLACQCAYNPSTPRRGVMTPQALCQPNNFMS